MFIGEEYKVDPTAVRFSEEMVEFNRVHTTSEFEATKLSIASGIGQLHPICINNITGLCEDGRHRVKACRELGIQVKCIQVDGALDKTTRLSAYNIDAMSGRELTTAQKAIQAHKYSLITQEPLDECAIRFNTVRRQVTAANAIAGLGRQDVFDSIMDNGQWMKPDGKFTKDLRSIASILKQGAEELETVSGYTPPIDYEELLNTELAKSEFWGLRLAMENSYHERLMVLIHMLNYKYILKVNEETGEVKEEKKDESK